MSIEQAFQKIDQALSQMADNGDVEEAWALRGLLDHVECVVAAKPVAWDCDPNYRKARRAACAVTEEIC